MYTCKVYEQLIIRMHSCRLVSEWLGCCLLSLRGPGVLLCGVMMLRKIRVLAFRMNDPLWACS